MAYNNENITSFQHQSTWVICSPAAPVRLARITLSKRITHPLNHRLILIGLSFLRPSMMSCPNAASDEDELGMEKERGLQLA
jgi:hypothetical protein